MRRDLYFRIKGFSIFLSPTKNRKDAIPDLVQHFAKKHRSDFQKSIIFTQESLELLENYPWPGNSRELENLIKAIVTTTNEEKITPGHLAEFLNIPGEPPSLLATAAAEKWPKEKLLNEYQNIVLTECNGNKRRACEILGINRVTLNRRLKRMQKASIGNAD